MLISVPRRCVRNLCRYSGFPLARPLPSTPSAAGCPALFEGFAGTTGLSDFPCPSIIGVRPQTSRHVPQRHPLRVDTGSPGSRARCFRTCTGSRTARGLDMPGDNGTPDVAFRISLLRRHPGGMSVSRLNTRPARTPVNASPTPLRTPPHDSGPSWAANPSTYDSFIHNTSPV